MVSEGGVPTNNKFGEDLEEWAAPRLRNMLYSLIMAYPQIKMINYFNIQRDEAERYNIKGKEIISGTYKYYMNDLAFKNYLYSGLGYGIGYLLENLVYLELIRAGYEVYVGSIKDKEVDFVAMKDDRVIYIQSTYILTDEQTILREYAPLESISDNYEKMVVSLDELALPLREGIRHVQAWRLNEIL